MGLLFSNKGEEEQFLKLKTNNDDAHLISYTNDSDGTVTVYNILEEENRMWLYATTSNDKEFFIKASCSQEDDPDLGTCQVTKFIATSENKSNYFLRGIIGLDLLLAVKTLFQTFEVSNYSLDNERIEVSDDKDITSVNDIKFWDKDNCAEIYNYKNIKIYRQGEYTDFLTYWFIYIELDDKKMEADDYQHVIGQAQNLDVRKLPGYDKAEFDKALFPVYSGDYKPIGKYVAKLIRQAKKNNELSLQSIKIQPEEYDAFFELADISKFGNAAFDAFTEYMNNK